MGGLDDMNHISNVFNSSLVGDNDIDLNYYLSAYDELYGLCSLLGTIFSFVGSEILSKLDVLRKLKRNDEDGNFNTMISMIQYEESNDLLYKQDYVSGSRTFLRLHRGLAFFLLFLTKVNQLNMGDSASKAGREAYDQTLSPYHSWFVRNGAAGAMYFLPTKEVLLNRVCRDSNIDECVKALPRMLGIMETVYNRVQEYYSENKLLDLP